jgi:Uma2 family endonuclease
MTAVQTRMTLAEFLAMRERTPALEYEDGRVTQKVSPKARHSVLQTWLATEWNRHLRPPRLGLAFTELRSTFSTLSRVPDVAVYRWERIPLDEQGRVVDDFFEPPDIAVEIASPGQRRSRLLQRCRRLVDAGVRVALLIQPADESVTVVWPGQEPERLTAGQILDLSQIIPGLQLDVAALFAALRL